MNSGEIDIVDDYGTMDNLSYSDEAYWPVGAPYIGHSVELVEPYNSRKLSSNWFKANEYFQNPFMATEDGEWDVTGNYNYGTPGSYNIAYDNNHFDFCVEEIDPDCELTKYDCDNVFNGLAFIDLCNNCSGGSTENIPSIYNDESGICVGDPSKIDCSCTCFGDPTFGATIDDCGVCTLGTTSLAENQDFWSGAGQH